MNPTLEQIDEIRKKGFRPSVISLVIFNKKVLMVFKAEYIQWIFPQGGIDNKQLPGQTMVNELQEEIGPTLVQNLGESFYIIGEDYMEFPENKHGATPLELDDGTPALMKGKQYYYCVIDAKTDQISLEAKEYDDLHWANYTEAKFLTDQMLHKNKKVMQGKIVDALKEGGYIE